MANTWTDQETYKLLELWGDEEVQAMLEGCTRNRHVYDQISRGMSAAGYNRTGLQCQEKVKKMKQDFKKIKDNNNETGRRRKSWKFYDCMNEILGERPATRPAVILDSSNLDRPEEMSSNESVDAESDKVTVADCDESSSKGSVITTEDNTKESEVENENVEDKESEDDTKKTPDTKKKRPFLKGKKCTREERLEKAMDSVVKKVAESQKKSDELFVRLEEKRMKLEFKMQLFMMLQQGSVQPATYGSPYYGQREPEY